MKNQPSESHPNPCEGVLADLPNPLLEMFLRQQKMQAIALNEMVPKDSPVQFYLHATACMVELGEAIQCDTRWKTLIGGKRPAHVDEEDKLEELVDAFHFLINAFLFSGFGYADLVRVFDRKWAANIARQQKE